MAVHRPFRTVFKLDGEPETKVNESVTFNYGVQAEQDPTCHVDFGDGTRQEVSCNKRKIIEGQFSQTISHSYEEPGTYDVRLTVDAGSRTRETTKQVEVHDIFGGQTLVVQTTRSDIEYSVRLLWGNIKGVIGTIEGIDLGYPGLSDRTTSRFVIDEATSERGADGYEFNGMIQEIRAEDPSSITVLVSGNRRPDLVTQMPDCDFQSRIVQFADEDGDCTIEEEELERAEQLMLQDEYTAEQYRSIRQAAE